MEYIVCCRFCGQKLKRQGQDYYCPTCLKEVSFDLEDISDNGEWAKRLEESVDLDLAVKRLPEKEQKIAKMIGEGYSWREIKNELKISEATIYQTMKKLKKQMTK